MGNEKDKVSLSVESPLSPEAVKANNYSDVNGDHSTSAQDQTPESGLTPTNHTNELEYDSGELIVAVYLTDY